MDTYEKKYKEAEKWIESIYSELSHEQQMEAEAFFLELKENEDEKVRKEIQSAIEQLDKDSTLCGKKYDYNQWLAWLEKQGEQKPADNVEPKFKVGDWIIFNEHHNSVYQVEKIQGLRYYLRHHTGSSLSVYIDNELIRPWTIQDAKDGDVVVDKTDGVIGIFQSIGHHSDGGSCNDPSYCFLHCRYDDGYFYADFENGNTIDSDDVIPATKEQRDTLIKAMTDAGWEFDFEKKELKKISQRMTPAEADEAMSHIPAWSEEDKSRMDNLCHFLEKYGNLYYGYLTLQGTISWLKSLKDRVRPKQEWNKEDETKMRAALAFIKSEFPKKGNEEIMEDTTEWLKSLRHQKQLWKSVDKDIYISEPTLAQRKDIKEDDIFKGYVLCADHTFTPDVYKRYISLRDITNQKQWKPSDEQMRALHDLNLTGNISYAGQGQTLIELYNDLKKLKAQ